MVNCQVWLPWQWTCQNNDCNNSFTTYEALYADGAPPRKNRRENLTQMERFDM